MQIKKVMERRAIIIISIMVIASCDTKKGNINTDKIAMHTNTIGIGIKDNDNLNIKQTHLKMKQFQTENTVYFNLNKYDIRPEFIPILDAQASFLLRKPSYKITIEGHTDERGTPEYNIALGERRANAIKMYLQSKGVLNEQMSIVSYGKEKPAVLGHDELTYAKNRRAILVY